MWPIVLLALADALCARYTTCSDCIAHFWNGGSCAWYVPHNTVRIPRCMAGALKSAPPVNGTRRFQPEQAGLEIVLYDYDKVSSTQSCYTMDCAIKPMCQYGFVKTNDVPCSSNYAPVWRTITCCSQQANENGFTDGYSVVENAIDGNVYYMKCCPHCHPGTFLDTVAPQDCQPDMTCHLCPAGTYNREQGLLTIEYCLPCSDLTCPYGKYRERCGGAYEGYCSDCEVGYWGKDCVNQCAACPAARYRVGCGGAHEGTCELCPLKTFWSPPNCRDCKSCTYIPGAHRISCMGHNPGLCTRCAPDSYEQSVGVCTPCSSCPSGQLRLGCGAETQGGCVALQSVSISGSKLEWDTIGDVFPFGGPSQTYCIADYGTGCSASDLSAGYWQADLMRANITELPSETFLVARLGSWWPQETSREFGGFGSYSVTVQLPESVGFPLTAYFVRVSFIDDESHSTSSATPFFSLSTKDSSDFPFQKALDAAWGRTVDISWLHALQRINAWQVFADSWTLHGANTIASVGIQEASLHTDWIHVDCRGEEVCPLDVVAKVGALWNSTFQILSSVLSMHLDTLGQLSTDITALDTVIANMAEKADFSYVNVAQACTRAVYNEAEPLQVLRCLVWLMGASHSESFQPRVRWIQPEVAEVKLTTEWVKFTTAVTEALENAALDEVVQVVEDIGALIMSTGGGTRNLHARNTLPNLEILEDLLINVDPRNGSAWGFGRDSRLRDEEEKLRNAGIEMQQLMMTRMRLFSEIVRLSGAAVVLKEALSEFAPLPQQVTLYTEAYLARAEPWLKDRANEYFDRTVVIGTLASELTLVYAWHRILRFRRHYLPNIRLTPPQLDNIANAFTDARAEASIYYSEFTGEHTISDRTSGFIMYDIASQTHPLALTLAPGEFAINVAPLPYEAKLRRKILNARRTGVYAFLRGPAEMKVEAEGSCIPESMANGLTAEELAANGYRLCGSSDFIQVHIRPLRSAADFVTKHESTRCSVSVQDNQEGALYTTWFISIPNVEQLRVEDNDLRVFFKVDFKQNGASTQHVFLGQKGDILHKELPARCKDKAAGDYHVWPTTTTTNVIELGNATIQTNVTSEEESEESQPTFGPGVVDSGEGEEEDENALSSGLNGTTEIRFEMPTGPVKFKSLSNEGDANTEDVAEGSEWREWAIAGGIFFFGGIVIPGFYWWLQWAERRWGIRDRIRKRQYCPAWLSSKLSRLLSILLAPVRAVVAPFRAVVVRVRAVVARVLTRIARVFAPLAHCARAWKSSFHRRRINKVIAPEIDADDTATDPTTTLKEASETPTTDEPSQYDSSHDVSMLALNVRTDNNAQGGLHDLLSTLEYETPSSCCSSTSSGSSSILGPFQISNLESATLSSETSSDSGCSEKLFMFMPNTPEATPREETPREGNKVRTAPSKAPEKKPTNDEQRKVAKAPESKAAKAPESKPTMEEQRKVAKVPESKPTKDEQAKAAKAPESEPT
eukprot:GEMP01001947.1.p1 GENE.GEMP01001947.1~~GEMP01001947.1.p1  ORF type:complete len:1477 (+),score=360.58 GEMP01001947.1:75-4505(+)